MLMVLTASSWEVEKLHVLGEEGSSSSLNSFLASTLSTTLSLSFPMPSSFSISELLVCLFSISTILRFSLDSFSSTCLFFLSAFLILDLKSFSSANFLFLNSDDSWSFHPLLEVSSHI